ncbi:uncharacterized protein LOC130360597 [Hyla sarda]|uniref:uncharacterized protein LOC130360597 n=1 Tax=Hyla sarda TaxID=327740 RepID=UPI0024C2267A|nr:uncharacterized protein LOC130360597 [Hyla sarda]
MEDYVKTLIIVVAAVTAVLSWGFTCCIVAVCIRNKRKAQRDNADLREIIVHKITTSKSDQILDRSMEHEAVQPYNMPIPTPRRSPEKLTKKQREILESNERPITDDIIDASQRILQTQFAANGLQSCWGAIRGFLPAFGPSVQVHYDDDRCHAFTSCFRDGNIFIADSINRTLSHAGERQLKQIYSSVAHDPLKVVTFLDVERQPNNLDCGLYAIANAVELLIENGNPSYTYDNSKMRAHLALCIERGFFSPFPKEEILPSDMTRRPEDAEEPICTE